MKELSRSVCQAKQGKFLDADCTCPYSPYGDVAGPYRPYDDSLAVVDWLVSDELGEDTCSIGK
jgi:hypothetical protein